MLTEETAAQMSSEDQTGIFVKVTVNKLSYCSLKPKCHQISCRVIDYEALTLGTDDTVRFQLYTASLHRTSTSDGQGSDAEGLRSRYFIFHAGPDV